MVNSTQLPEPRNRAERRHGVLHSYESAASRLDCSPRLVRKLVQERRLASVKVAALVRIEDSAIDDYIARQRRDAVR
jgi:excisionase family DNA binding protein